LRDIIMAELIDGKKIAEEIKAELKTEIESLTKRVGRPPGLGVILVGDDIGSKVYVRNKRRACEELSIFSEEHLLDKNIGEDVLRATIERLNKDARIDGILLQLPLPDHLDEDKMVSLIDPAKDVDGFHQLNLGRLLWGKELFVPCTPLGVQQLLLRSGVSIEGKHVVIVGRSNIVGKPLAVLLMQKKQGANATVTICHSRTRDLAEIMRTADILIAAMGSPRTVTAEMVKQGAVVVDVGINRIPDPGTKSGYRLVGDVDFEKVKDIASKITPVPGGVGPMTIAMLVSNTVRSFKMRNGLPV
jgi:methylenetetrahydrofolate dehydrogenase (NADP+)/methenyltetrahydrofolate cyclohydrolase